LEGLARDELTVNEEYLSDDAIFKGKMMTDDFINKHFNHAFDRNYSVEFLVNPSMS